MYPLHKKNPTLQIFVWQSLKLSCTIFLWISCWPWTTYIKNESGIKNIFVPQVLKKKLWLYSQGWGATYFVRLWFLIFFTSCSIFCSYISSFTGSCYWLFSRVVYCSIEFESLPNCMPSLKKLHKSSFFANHTSIFIICLLFLFFPPPFLLLFFLFPLFLPFFSPLMKSLIT